MPESEPSTEALSVGQRVVVLGKRKGTVRFVGSTAFGPGCDPPRFSLLAEQRGPVTAEEREQLQSIRKVPVHGMFACRTAPLSQLCSPARLPR